MRYTCVYDNILRGRLTKSRDIPKVTDIMPCVILPACQLRAKSTVVLFVHNLRNDARVDIVVVWRTKFHQSHTIVTVKFSLGWDFRDENDGKKGDNDDELEEDEQSFLDVEAIADGAE